MTSMLTSDTIVTPSSNTLVISTATKGATSTIYLKAESKGSIVSA